ncbi:uncharacterized protein Tco025E_09200, partial [Trypanosoma conorhini]
REWPSQGTTQQRQTSQRRGSPQPEAGAVRAGSLFAFRFPNKKKGGQPVTQAPCGTRPPIAPLRPPKRICTAAPGGCGVRPCTEAPKRHSSKTAPVPWHVSSTDLATARCMGGSCAWPNSRGLAKRRGPSPQSV